MSKYRPCTVGKDNRPAIFHRWIEKTSVVPAPKPNFRGGICYDTWALVEYQDGSLDEVLPCTIRFLDSGRMFHKDRLYFMQQTEGRNDAR